MGDNAGQSTGEDTGGSATRAVDEALVQAVTGGDYGAAMVALRRGANPRFEAQSPFDPDLFVLPVLHIASGGGFLGIVNLLMTEYSVPVDYVGEECDFVTALYQACLNGHETVVRHLVMHGANVDGVDPYQRPLCGAIEAGDVRIVRLLIESGADVNAEMTWASPFDLACRNGNVEIVNLMLEAGAEGLGAIAEAAGEGHVEIVRKLIPHCDLGDLDMLGRTAFHEAVLRGNVAILQLLVEAGDDVTQLCQLPHGGLGSPVQVCQAMGHHDAVVFLNNLQ